MMVHVDGDVIRYRAGYAAEHTIYHVSIKGPDGKQERHTFDGAKEYQFFLKEKELGPLDFMLETEVVVEDESAAVYNARSIISSIASDLQVDEENELTVYLSGPSNYRLQIAKTKPYKGNRDPARKPVHVGAITDFIHRRYNVRVSDGQEADDDMGIAHYSMWGVDPTSTVIATIDKDLNTVPGLHYNFVSRRSYNVTPAEAVKFFWTQMVSGDTVDNVPGVPGYGAAKAEKYLAEFDGTDEAALREHVRALYVQSYGDSAEEVMKEMGQLLYIRKRPDEWWQ